MAAAGLALLVANSPLADAYNQTLRESVLGVSPLHAINDGLMALFFLLVGLEIKRELAVGALATWPRRALPGLAALGGMAVPALIYAFINLTSPGTLRGWAIPAATDIAFSLAVLALVGSRVPPSLKIFLTALAILDDLGAIVIIAIFYATDLSPLMLTLAAAVFVLLTVLNRLGVTRLAPYLGLGALLWFLVLKSGVHATIGGVLLAMTIPVRTADDAAEAPLVRLERRLQPLVNFVVLPIFGFANAGVSLVGLNLAALTHPVSLGIAAGLFLGKQVGVFGSLWLAVRLKLAKLPEHATAAQSYGVAILCGIGFTMSLFIGLLAFPAAASLQDETKIGVLVGSLLSALLGWVVLRLGSPKPRKP
jgi:NhaA family Na+:H+ antiporter